MRFRSRGAQDLYNGIASSRARRVIPSALRAITIRKLQFLDQALSLEDLASVSGNQLELLRGDRIGQHSIRINDQYRICFIWSALGAINVEIVDYH